MQDDILAKAVKVQALIRKFLVLAIKREDLAQTYFCIHTVLLLYSKQTQLFDRYSSWIPYNKRYRNKKNGIAICYLYLHPEILVAIK